MSLQARLRISFLLLVFTVVIAISALHVQTVVESELAATEERANVIVEQVQALAPQQLGPRRALLPQLVRSLSKSPSITEVLVADRAGEVRAATRPEWIGKALPSTVPFERWQERPIPLRLWDLAWKDQQYHVEGTLPVDIRRGQLGGSVHVLLSLNSLRAAILPEVADLLFVSACCLFSSFMLAFLFTDVALAPLRKISRQLDLITAGQTTAPDPDGDAKVEEVAHVESKLLQLGRRFKGAQDRAARLRANVGRMLQRLEEGVLLFDGQGRLVVAGQSAGRMLGRPHQELVGLTLEQVFPRYTPQGRAIHDSLESGEPLRDHAVTMDRHGLPGARVLVNVEPPLAPGAGMLVTLRDADTRHEVASQLDLSSRLASINRLTQGVAHEMRNPLNGMALQLEVLKGRWAPDEVPPEVEVIGREMARLNRAVKTFLEFTRPQQVSRQSVNLAVLAEKATEEARMEATPRGIRVECRLETTEPLTTGDPGLLASAVRHVVRNALDAIEGPGTVVLRLRRTFQELVLTISDSGPGIAPEAQDRVFNLYFTTKQEGTGVGLAEAFQIMQLHNGSIDFLSEAGRGTTFRLKLPAVEKSEVPERQPVDKVEA